MQQKNRLFGTAAISVLILSSLCLARQDRTQNQIDEPSVRIARGFVSRPETAIAIAEAVIKGINSRFDSKTAKLRAIKRDGYWLVMTPQPGIEAVGGNIEIEIEIHSGAIIRYWASK